MSLDNQVTTLPCAPISRSSVFQNWDHSPAPLNFSVMSKALVSTQHKTFIAKLLMLIIHLYSSCDVWHLLH